MRNDLHGDIVFDTGPSMEMLMGSPSGSFVRSKLADGTIRAILGEMNIGELRYLICRNSGWKKSVQIVEDLLATGYFTVVPVADYLMAASELKCERTLSLVDCITLSIGAAFKAPTLFADFEEELVKEMKKKPFKQEIIFLNEILKRNA